MVSQDPFSLVKTTPPQRSILPASRHHPAISSQPSAWKPCAAAFATRAQSSLRKVFLRSGLYFGPASRPKNPEFSDGRARAGKTSIRYSPLVANRACSGSLKVAPSALRKHQIGEELENMPSLPRLAGCTPPPRPAVLELSAAFGRRHPRTYDRCRRRRDV